MALGEPVRVGGASAPIAPSRARPPRSRAGGTVKAPRPGQDDTVTLTGAATSAPYPTKKGVVQQRVPCAGCASVKELREIAEELRTENALSPKLIDMLVEKLEQETPFTPDEIKQIKAYEQDLNKLHRSLHTKIKEGDRTAKTIRTLEKVHLFTDTYHKIKIARGRAKKDALYDEISAGMPEPIRKNPVYRTFFQDADISADDMKEVLGLVQGLERGDSPLLSRGNKVTVLTREEIWQTKIRLQDEAQAAVRGGMTPPENDVQYYELSSPEMVGKIKTSAELGLPIRVNIDPGRFSKIAGDDDEGKVLDASEVLAKLRMATYFLDQIGTRDVGISLYPVKRELGASQYLMHRKLHRMGDRAVLAGMNANPGSGENVDAGKLVEGPAVRRLTEIFAHDVEASKGAALEDLYDPKDLAMIEEGKVRLSPFGVLALLQIFAKDEEVLSNTVTPQTVKKLLDHAAVEGYDITKLADWPDADGNKKLTRADVEAYLLQKEPNSKDFLTITPKAGTLIVQLLRETIERLNGPENRKRLSAVALPDQTPKGKDVMAIADAPAERMAILLHAVATAEEFVYVPSFVLTRLLARTVAARQQQLAAQGKALQVATVVDAGIYPGGRSPNEDGILELEDAGIPARWAMLKRTDPAHARKIHAKGVITDKGMLSGSTNPSKKGLTGNHEMGDFTYWRPDDPESMANRKKAVDDFKKTFDTEGIEINTRLLADKKFARTRGRDVEVRKQEYRKILTRLSLRYIDVYGKAYAKDVVQKILQNAAVWEKVQHYQKQGIARGYAILKAVEESTPGKELDAMKEALPAWKTLTYFSTHGEAPENKRSNAQSNAQGIRPVDESPPAVTGSRPEGPPPAQ